MNIRAEINAKRISLQADKESSLNTAERLEKQFALTVRNLNKDQTLILTCIYMRWLLMGFTTQIERDTIIAFLKQTPKCSKK